ncbi:MAG: methyltransferase domain-containing protein [Actinobacteria bacterium]|nr:methyltransferase domain-containing protein [Actinomycetota bacterium]
MADDPRSHESPRTAVVWSVLRAELRRRRDLGVTELAVLDVGGGSGVFAVPLAEMGLTVTVVDASADALATLQRRAAEAGVAGRVVAVQGDADRIAEAVQAASYDLVLCHSILEVVEDPGQTIATIARLLRPGGRASVLVANRVATVLARVLSGRVAEAARAFADPAGRSGAADAVRRRFDTGVLTGLLEAGGLVVERLHGVRVVADLVPGAMLEGVPGGVEALLDLELAAAATPPYRDIAAQLHAFARRP